MIGLSVLDTVNFWEVDVVDLEPLI